MSIQFIPLGIPFSSSYAVTASLALNTLSDGFPTTASYAEFAVNPVGPSGSNGKQVTGSIITI